MKELIAAALAVGFLASAPVFAAGDDELNLAKSKGCMACHKVDTKLTGPAYKDVAAKYAGQKDAVTKLAEKVRAGGAGVWKDKGIKVPMPANKNVSEEEAKKLVTWILSLK